MRLDFTKLFVLPLASLGLIQSAAAHSLEAKIDKKTGTITIHREGLAKPLVTQHAAADHRPYLHPIIGPNGKGVFTEYSPGHHKHQTGLYFGFT
ncbi:MAG: PmoA family protein, partial [Verrucomicrobiota bacterium]|nr:PmoA family protein [Verrucomicrobiota bacterium]